MEPIRRNEKYTYRDYRGWSDDERWELIDGVAYAMSPAPSIGHQSVVQYVSLQLGKYLEGKPCRVFTSPIDVLFSEEDDPDTIVQPDIIVVCDASKIRRQGIVGAPDLAVEVLSPSTAGRDMIDKLRLYEREGICEYWIISPDEAALYKHILKNRRYETEKLTEGQMPSSTLEGFALDLDELLASLEGLPR